MKTVFWNVDTQNDFMRKKGSLYVPDAELIISNLEKITNFAEKQGIKVINTGDDHNLNSKELSENPDFINTFPDHCLRGTWGAKYIATTKPKNPYVIRWDDKDFDVSKLEKSRNIILTKDYFDIFQGTPHIENILDELDVDKAVAYGVATNYCVDYAVVGLLKRNVSVYVLTDAIKELPADDEPKKTFDKWDSLGAILTTTDEFIDNY